jgi:hypothetical protein
MRKRGWFGGGLLALISIDDRFHRGTVWRGFSVEHFR